MRRVECAAEQSDPHPPEMGGQADVPPVSALPFHKAGTKRRAAGGALRHAVEKLDVDVRANGRSLASNIRNLSMVKGTGRSPEIRCWDLAQMR